MATPAGELGQMNYSYTSVTNRICLQLLTDGTIGAPGFNATYTKIYNGTDLKGMHCVCVHRCQYVIEG